MSARLPAPRRRRQLMEVALERFAAQGFHGTSMEEIADSAGVTKPVLYQHFASKRELYQELVMDVANELTISITRATHRASGPRQQVEEGFRAYFRFVAEHRSAFQLLFGTGPPREEDLADLVRQVEDAMAGTVAGLIQADLDDVHRLVLGHAIVGLAEATSRRWVHHDLDLDPDVLAGQIANLAWAGLRSVRP